MRRFLQRLIAFLRPGRAERELARQVAADLKLYEDEFVRRGRSPEEAAREARLAFGGVEQVKERHRDARSFLVLDDLRQDLRYAVRSFMRTPGFTIVAVLTLALGTGANTTIFSIVNGVMLRPLPYPDGDQLVRIVEHLPASMQSSGTPGLFRGLEATDFVTWQRDSHLLAAVAAYDSHMAMTLSDDESEAIRLTGASATPSLFPLLGAHPSLGPGFRADDPDLDGTILLSAATWKHVFGSDATVVGRPITLDGTTYRVVGIMPDDFAFPTRDTAFWVPVAPRASARGELTEFEVIGRLKQGVAPKAAAAEATSLLTGLQGMINERPHGAGEFEVLRLKDDMVASVRPALLVLLFGVGLVLLVACANVANLMLARNALRRGEAAVRIALGAGRSRLVRQLLTESAVLGFLGGAAGLAIAAGALQLLRALGPTDLPQFEDVHLDRTTLAFSFVLSTLTGLLVGVLPALRVSRSSPIASIKSDLGSRVSRRDTSRSVLVIAEVATATVLLVGGGLLLRSFIKLTNVNPGFDVDRLLVFQVALPRGAAPRATAVAMSDTFRDRLAALPGVKAVAFGNRLPLRQRNGTAPRIEGFPATLHGRPEARIVSSNYPATLGIQIREGHGLENDRKTGQGMTVLVNEALAHSFGPNVIGTPLTVAQQAATIVGVVSDTHDAGLDHAIQPLVYIDARDMALRMLRADAALGWAFYAVRASGNPQDLLPGIRRALHDLLPAATLELDVDSMDGIIARSIAERRFYAVIFSLFAALAVLLASLGVYGVMAYTVTERTREIGIRMALGAAAADVVGLVLRHSVPVTLIGILTGLAGAFALTRFLEGMLFGLTPLDPSTFTGVAILLALVATLAALIPARRATRVDPLIALRYD